MKGFLGKTGLWGKEITAKSTTTARDFFLWAGALLALYGSVTAFLTLTFSYINSAYPDIASTGTNSFTGTIPVAMAALIILAPLSAFLLSLIRRTISTDEGKANIWIRRWALVFTLFVVCAVAAVDLITLITTYLGGEITIRFTLKVIVVLLVVAFFFMHFLADLKNYWLAFPKKAQAAGAAALIVALATLVAGFLIIGSPSHLRSLHLDSQKVTDLETIQYDVTNYYQQNGKLPASLSQLNDTLSGILIPSDPQSHAAYEYASTGTLSFKLCATFNTVTGDKTDMYDTLADSFYHTAGHTCFARTIDPAKYPLYNGKPMP